MSDLIQVVTPAGPIRRFSDSGLNESITKALAGVEAGHGNAILDIDTEGAKAVILQRVGDHWDIVATGQLHWHGKPEFEVAIRRTW